MNTEKQNNHNSRSAVPVPVLLAAGLGCAFLLPPPWAFALMFLLFTVAFAWWIAAARGNAAKNIALCFLTLSLALLAGEGWLGFSAWKKGTIHQQTQSLEPAAPASAAPVVPAPVIPTEDGAVWDLPEEYMQLGEYFFRNDPNLGYGPRPIAGRMHVAKECSDQMAYDVVYTTLPSGWRVTPQHSAARKAVVLFGCSFTWGEGLNDHDTFAWKLGEMLGPDTQVFNFGIQGYGSHHMLAWIEQGLLADIAAHYDSVQVFYSTIRGHELRSMGYSQWDPSGPWYGFEKGRIVRKGVFADNISSLRPYTDAVFGKSMIYRKIQSTKFIPRWMRFKHHAGIIREADRRVEELCGTRLTAMLWPEVLFKEELEAEGVAMLDLDPLFPDWDEQHDKYRIPCDSHPNALANDIVARAIYDYLAAHP
ncbi:phage holin family protein [Desulfovibrio sp. OttesenSCG-928-I05]|nr:phage holin family protein [Desulfovibrio sp. OttesenSCG-928-I05]